MAALRGSKKVSAAIRRNGYRPRPLMIAPHVSMRVAAGVVCLFFLAAAATAFHPPQQKPSQRKASTTRHASTSSSNPAQFADVTHAAGIDFHLTCGSLEKRYIMETMCGGIAVFDYDNDGWMDIFLVNGSTLEDLRAGKCHPSKLYRNNHDGTFTDVTVKAGLSRCGWGFGVAVGDYDNDGWEDLYVTYLKDAVLYHNNHDGTFTDVTVKGGVSNADRWGTSAAFGDYDNDGYLDLYVANYVDVDLKHLPELGSGPFCQYRGIPVSCGPRGLKGSRDRLYHNNGDGTFSDVTEKLNIDSGSYYGLGVLWLDYDNDGWKDIFIANGHVNPQVDKHTFGVTYAERPLLFHNLKTGKFEEIGSHSGTALARRYAARGTAVADFLNNGRQDVIMTVLDGSPVLLRNQTPAAGHWLCIKTIGKRSNRDGFGARVEIKAGGLTQYDEVRANSSFESASDPRLHFGLDNATRVDSIVVRWPSGKVDTVENEDADQELVIEEERGITARHTGAHRLPQRHSR